MKYLLFILLSIYTASDCASQHYVPGQAPQEIDQLAIDIEELLKEKKDSLLGIKIDQLSNYWSGPTLPATAEVTRGNYYYSRLFEFERVNISKGKPKTKTEKQEFVRELEALEKNMLVELNKEHPLFSMVYELLARSNYAIFEIDNTIVYYKKAIDLINATATLNIKKNSTNHNRLGNAYLRNRDYVEALKAYQTGFEICTNKSPVDSIGLIYSYYNLARVAEKKRLYDDNLEYLKLSESMAQELLEPDHRMIVLIQDALSLLYLNNADYPNALIHAENVLQAVKLNPNNILKLVDGYTTKASVYRKMNRFDQAISYLDSAILLKLKHQDLGQLSYLYNDKANNLLEGPDKIDYYQKAIDHCETDPSCTLFNKAVFYSNIALEYSNLGSYVTALNYINQSIQIKESDLSYYGFGLTSSYSIKAGIYDKLQRSDESISYFQKAIQNVRVYEPERTEKIAFYMSNLANAYIKNKEYAKAERLLEDALSLKIPADIPKEETNSNLYGQLEFLNLERKEWTKALSYNSKNTSNTLIRNGKNSKYFFDGIFNKAIIFKNLNQIDSTNTIINDIRDRLGFKSFENGVVQIKSNNTVSDWLALDMLFRITKLECEVGNTSNLAVKILSIIKIINKIRSTHYFRSSEIEYQNKLDEFFDWAVARLYEQYEETYDRTFLELMQQCFEKNKSISINRTFERIESVNEKLVPESIIMREKRIMSEYEIERENLEDMERKGQDSLIAIQSNLLFELQRKKEDFIDSLKSNYPAYFSKRYSQQVIELSELESLVQKDKVSILQFHWSDSLCHIICVNEKGSQVERVKSSVIKPLVQELNQILTDRNLIEDENRFYSSKSKFIVNSSELYNLIFKSSNFNNLSSDLIIIPDGLMVSFPFDVLLTENVDPNLPYKQLPYLIKKHAISYVTSATEYERLKHIKTDKQKKQYIGFGPQYKNTTEENTNNRSIHSNLLHNIKEIQYSGSLFESKELIGPDATESSFKTLASDYNMVHLSMHAIIDDQLPLYSYLSFHSDTSNIDDGRLHIHEIVEMDINADLVVLGACQTNSGDETKGESILGLAKAFQLASCNNILMSNWLVDDRSASIIIHDFFGGIKGKRTAAQSLQSAKLDYLHSSSAIHSHPSYWATFAFYGNGYQPFIEEYSPNNVVKVFVGLSLLMIVLLIGRKQLSK